MKIRWERREKWSNSEQIWFIKTPIKEAWLESIEKCYFREI